MSSEYHPLTQSLLSSAPRQNLSRLPIEDEEDYVDFNQGNSETYEAPTTRSKAGVVKKAPLKSVEHRVLQSSRVDKVSRYGQREAPAVQAEITTGDAVRLAHGAYINLTGKVVSTTKNGANIELDCNKRLLTGISKKQILLVNGGRGESASATARETPAKQAPVRKARAPAPTPTRNALPALGGLSLNAGHGLPSSRPVVPSTRAPPALPSRPAAGGAHQAASAISPLPSGGASPGRSSQPKVFSVPRPMPHHQYMVAAYQSPAQTSISIPLLVILDLNGTLLFRRNKGSSFQPRPHLDAFLEYLFSNHVVMVWSSAKPHNVVNMCKKFFTPEQFNRVAAIWTRDNLRLSPQAYAANTQVYKQLSWVWQDPNIQAKNPVPGGYWDQSNTVLLDDSVEKSASEPFNLVRIEEFEDRPDQQNEDVLSQVALYLDVLRSQRDVTAYIRSQPFAPDRAMPRAALEARQVADHMARGQRSQFLER